MYLNINKKLLLTASVLFLLALAGCQGNGNKNPITDVDIRNGFDGLTLEFLKNAPPDNIFEGGDGNEMSIFPISVNLKNKGASDIEKGILVFSFEKAYIDAVKESDANRPFDIKGKSIYNPNGDEEIIAINAHAKRIGAQSETHTSNILATACYPYKTIFGDSVCIDTDVYGERIGKKACSVKDLEYTEGQGAPVAITKIEARMLPDLDENKVKPNFVIYLENRGNGEVIKLDKTADACTNKPLEYTDFNTIRISASLSGKAMDCKASDDDSASIIRLRDKKDMVRCTLKEGINKNFDSYTALLSIELEYGYTFTASKDIIIEKIFG